VQTTGLPFVKISNVAARRGGSRDREGTAIRKKYNLSAAKSIFVQLAFVGISPQEERKLRIFTHTRTYKVLNYAKFLCYR